MNNGMSVVIIALRATAVTLGLHKVNGTRQSLEPFVKDTAGITLLRLLPMTQLHQVAILCVNASPVTLETTKMNAFQIKNAKLKKITDAPRIPNGRNKVTPVGKITVA